MFRKRFFFINHNYVFCINLLLYICVDESIDIRSEQPNLKYIHTYVYIFSMKFQHTIFCLSTFLLFTYKCTSCHWSPLKTFFCMLLCSFSIYVTCVNKNDVRQDTMKCSQCGLDILINFDKISVYLKCNISIVSLTLTDLKQIAISYMIQMPSIYIPWSSVEQSNR